MIYVHQKVKNRISANLSKYQRIVQNAVNKDINESDTSVIVTDMLCDLFGYEKYSDITTETAIRGTYCDLGIQINKKLKLLIELKAAGIDLKQHHIKQAIDYAANKGIDWVILTNGLKWYVYKVSFTKPINKELVYEFTFTDLKTRNKKDLELLFSISKEGLMKMSLNELYEQSLTTNKYIVGNLLFSESVVDSLRKEIKRNFKYASQKNTELKEILSKDVIKREIIEGEDADLGRKKIKNKIKLK